MKWGGVVDLTDLAQRCSQLLDRGDRANGVLHGTETYKKM
ncbi:hypothetical protein CKA32_004810 [Geitlerinema sp. FC II]|nr:hypothetical protein CKA32_004810 [Geitlerinema sp. FC II]